MRGRTNISGNGGNGVELGADIRQMTISQGDSIVAGNFVQYKIVESDRRYSGGYGYGRYLFRSNGNRNHTLYCGNDRYIVQYANADAGNIWFFMLIDLSYGFNVLSTISITNSFIPHFCLLSDGNMALSYMDSDNTFTVEIYDMRESFALISSYYIYDESIGEAGSVGVCQIADMRIIAMKGWSAYACNYSEGSIQGHDPLIIPNEEKPYSYYVQNAYFDWDPYPIGGNKFLCFAAFTKTTRQTILFEVSENNLNITESDSTLFPQSAYIGDNIWGIGFLDGKMLYTKSGTEGGTIENDAIDYWKAYILYVNDNTIMQSPEVDIYQMVIDAFEGVPIASSYPVDSYSSGTIQFVKPNVFYAAVMPYRYTVSGSYKTIFNPNCRTAIIRIEYDPKTFAFASSNIIAFESENIFIEEKTKRFGFGKFFESEDGKAYYLYETQSGGTGKTGRWIMSLNYKNGILEMGERTEYVENYNGKTAIGVAKQSGKSGDKIEVYVPKPV